MSADKYGIGQNINLGFYFYLLKRLGYVLRILNNHVLLWEVPFEARIDWKEARGVEVWREKM